MRKIGIIDYFIDEWHSNTYLSLFEKANEELGLDFKICYGWAELDTFPGKLSTEEWCKKNGIEQCKTLEELCEKSDNILILAPANPETHLKYAETALSYGKNTYIDKTFAPDYESAKAIFELGKKYGTKFFSTSALRFTKETDDLSKVKSLQVWGAGRKLEEYVIHQIEMAVKIMDEKADTVRVFNRDKQANVIIEFGDKVVGLNYSHSEATFGIDAQTDGEGLNLYRPITDGDYFYKLCRAILKFFDDGVEPFNPEQTLSVIAIRDAIIKGMNLPFGEPVKVE